MARTKLQVTRTTKKKPVNPKRDPKHDRLYHYTIYCITSERANLAYIGSTRQLLKSRLSIHYHDYRNPAKRGLKASRLVLREPDHKVTVLEVGTCSRKEKEYILLRELYFTKNYDGRTCNDRDAIKKTRLRGIAREGMHNVISLSDIFKDT